MDGNDDPIPAYKGYVQYKYSTKNGRITELWLDFPYITFFFLAN